MYSQTNKLKTLHVFLISVVLTLITLLVINNPGKFTVKFISNQLASQVSQDEEKIIGVGVLGDSLSDEYQADDLRGSYMSHDIYNWVELLAEYRGLNFGEWEYSRLEPRRTGYEYNWSKSGATARSLIESGQHTGLADQIKLGKVNYVIVYIGANDFAPYTSNGYPAIYSETLTEEQVESKAKNIVDDVRITVETLQNAGDAKILLIKIPDWSKKYSIQQNFPDETRRNRVSNVINKINERLDEFEDDENTHVADPNDFYKNLTGESNSSLIKVGEIEINRVVPSHHPTSEFISDDIHFGTIMNGLFANFVISNLEEMGSEKIERFGTNELAEIAGLATN